MLSKAKTLKGYKLEGLDGEIGKVKEFYFDDQHWTIRYLVADTGNWLTDRQVLISPHALVSVNREEQHIGISLTRKQIEDSPSVSTDKPVSRQFEENYYGYYGWPMYWGGPHMWGTSGYPSMPGAGQGRQSTQGVISPHGLGASPAVLLNSEASMEFTQGVISPYGSGAASTALPSSETSVEIARDENPPDAHLRSTHDVSGYDIQAEDGEIGHVDDFVIDDETWAIRYIIVDTVNWWPGKKVLVAAQWIERVSWEESKVFINLSCAAIKQAPEFTEESMITRDYERILHGHYNREGYWEALPQSG